MLAGIREILVITTPQDEESFIRLLGNGDRYGVSFSFLAQESPDGLAQAFLIGFSSIEDTFPFRSNSTTPYLSGSLTL